MPIDRKGYRAAKKKYKSAVRDNKQVSKSNRKAMSDAAKSRKKNSKTQAKTIKKWEKSEKAATKAYSKKRNTIEKGHRKTEKARGLEKGSIIGNLPPRTPSPQPRFGVKYAPPAKMGYFHEGDKPKKSDYKGSKPQRATGSDASKSRMAKVIGQLNSAKMFMNTVSGKKRK